MINRILPENIKSAYTNTNLLPATFSIFNKKTGRCNPLAALYANYKLQKFVKNQRFHLFYDWDSAISDIEDWLITQYTLGYRDGWGCGFTNDDIFTQEIMESYKSGNVILTQLLDYWTNYYKELGAALTISLADFELGLKDGKDCLDLFEPIANKNQVALVWRQPC